MPTLQIKTYACRLLIPLLLVSTSPAWSADNTKDEETIKNAAAVLQAMLDSKTVPASLMVTANCIIVLPGVKKFAVGVGGSGGRGAMTCRTGKNFSGDEWSAPAMYTIGGASAWPRYMRSIALNVADTACWARMPSAIRPEASRTAAAMFPCRSSWSDPARRIIHASTRDARKMPAAPTRMPKRILPSPIRKREVLIERAL